MKHANRFFVLVAISLMTSVPSHAVSNVVPVVEGSITFYPESGAYFEASAYYMQAICQTTVLGLEYRRGFVEFIIPDLPRGMKQVTLVFGYASAQSPPPPNPVALNELSYYPADLVLSLADYDQVTTPITTFESDWNFDSQVFRFDVTDAVQMYKGKAIGFRIKMANDPLRCVETGRDYALPHLEILPGKAKSH